MEVQFAERKTEPRETPARLATPAAA